MCVEDRLAVVISDADALGGERRLAERTLRELAGVVRGYLPPVAESDARAEGLVLEAAAQVAGGPVTPADMDRPLLAAMRRVLWETEPVEPGAAPDRG